MTVARRGALRGSLLVGVLDQRVEERAVLADRCVGFEVEVEVLREDFPTFDQELLVSAVVDDLPDGFTSMTSERTRVTFRRAERRHRPCASSWRAGKHSRSSDSRRTTARIARARPAAPECWCIATTISALGRTSPPMTDHRPILPFPRRIVR